MGRTRCVESSWCGVDCGALCAAWIEGRGMSVEREVAYVVSDGV